MDIPGMSMPGNSSTSDDMLVMMTPWLHFNGGDNFFFKSLHPSSHGDIAAACIVLVFIAVLERWVSAMRGVLERHWDDRTTALIAVTATPKSDACAAPAPAKEKDVAECEVSSLQETPLENTLRNGRVSRITPPFVASHDIPRGASFAFQALLAYVLMLAVMTFQAAYIISIVVGLGLGEIVFGRMGSARAHILH